MIWMWKSCFFVIYLFYWLWRQKTHCRYLRTSQNWSRLRIIRQLTRAKYIDWTSENCLLYQCSTTFSFFLTRCVQYNELKINKIQIFVAYHWHFSLLLAQKKIDEFAWRSISLYWIEILIIIIWIECLLKKKHLNWTCDVEYSHLIDG